MALSSSYCLVWYKKTQEKRLAVAKTKFFNNEMMNNSKEDWRSRVMEHGKNNIQGTWQWTNMAGLWKNPVKNKENQCLYAYMLRQGWKMTNEPEELIRGNVEQLWMYES
ncbi:hypothetical protein CHARACLAT_027909 [Characodon lateralis]|uniref:Uncharacterized protein n=1 Tax=Characodon lateralis TaxID=208331 RepID=A0ABU7DKW7_9TELE|nr:hypothetical protein [Characodon lateralis]